MFLRIDFTISFSATSLSLFLFLSLPLALSLSPSLSLQMYDNVKSLRLTKEGSHTFVTAMISSEGEVLEFRYHRKYSRLPLPTTPYPCPCPALP